MREKQSYFVKSDYGIFDTDVQPSTQALDIVTEVTAEPLESATLEIAEQAFEKGGEQVVYKNDGIRY